MDVLIEFVKLATAVAALATAVIKLLSETDGPKERKDKDEGR